MKKAAALILGVVANLPCIALAATYFVATTGSDTSGDGTIGNPWATPAYGASRLTSDGDILYIRAGVYNVTTPTSNRSTAIFPRANNCTIAAYPDELVVLRGRGGVFPTGGVIGAVGGRSGLIIDRLTIQGMVMFDGNARGSRASRIQNSDLSVGGDGWPGTSQGAVVWMDDAVNVEVVNNRIHDNGQGAEATVAQNNGLFMIYECNECLIEKNTIYNSSGTGITMKDDVQNVTIRQNWIRDNRASGIYTGNNSADAYALSVSIYQNIFSNNNKQNSQEFGAIELTIETSQVNIFNNTFHNNYNADVVQWPNASNFVPFAFFNNISIGPRSRYLSWPYSSSTFGATYINFNNYFGGAGWVYRGASFSTLSAWQSTCQQLLSGCDSNSVNIDPGFVNASGNWSESTDYRRRSYAVNGRGGGYPSVMGAYVTGNEQIGHVGFAGPVPRAPAQVIAD